MVSTKLFKEKLLKYWRRQALVQIGRHQSFKTFSHYLSSYVLCFFVIIHFSQLQSLLVSRKWNDRIKISFPSRRIVPWNVQQLQSQLVSSGRQKGEVEEILFWSFSRWSSGVEGEYPHHILNSSWRESSPRSATPCLTTSWPTHTQTSRCPVWSRCCNTCLFPWYADFTFIFGLQLKHD